MPAEQRGSVVRKNEGFQARWYDESGQRRSRAGFRTKTEARKWVDAEVNRVTAFRRGGPPESGARPQTVDALLDLFLTHREPHLGKQAFKSKQGWLKHARREFGPRKPDSLRRLEIEAWRTTLPKGSGYQVFATLRQALTWGCHNGLLTHNGSDGIRNPQPRPGEIEQIVPFESWDEVAAIADELNPWFAAIPIFAAGTGMRPEEWIALNRKRDIDWNNRCAYVREVFTAGELKPHGKTYGSYRIVPLRDIVLEVIDAHAPSDSPLLFPSLQGGYINLDHWRWHHWRPAVQAAGQQPRRPYALRHTFCTWSIEAGMELWYLAEIMGTSTRQIETRYAHFLHRTPDRLRNVLNDYDRGITRGRTQQVIPDHGLGT